MTASWKACARFYAERLGRPSLRPGRYFRMLLIGYFEGLDSERAIGWRVADSMSVRAFMEYDPEEAVDLETGAVVAVTVQGAEAGDTKTMDKTLRMAREEVSAVQPGAEVREVVAGKGYHSTKIALELKQQGFRKYVSEPERKGRRWKGRVDAQRAVYGNRRRIRGVRGRRLQRQRSERVERPFAHRRETGGLRRIFVRGHPNMRKRLLVHVCGFNLGLLMRQLTGFGTPRSLQGRTVASIGAQLAWWSGLERLLKRCCASIRPDPSIVASQIHRYTI